jgi:hypothetical protein
MSSKKALVATNNYAMPTESRGLASFAGGDEDDPGDILKVSGKDGSITSGAQGFEHKPGLKLALFLGTLQLGKVRFKDNKLVAAKYLKVGEHDDPDAALRTLRQSLGDTNPAEWEETLWNGLPKDPFSDAVKLVAVEVSPRSGYLYTYKASSYWAVKAARKLVKSCITQQTAAPDTTTGLVPIAELTVVKKQRPNGGGTYYVPHWEVCDWQPVGVIMHALAKTGQSGALGIQPKEAINEDLGPEPEAEQPAPKKKAGPRFA